MSEIVLATINAKYFHTAFGLRYLFANLGDLQPQAALLEFQKKQSRAEMAKKILEESPRIVGLGVYIWNVKETQALIQELRKAQKDLIIILGGPEVSYETHDQTVVQDADYVIQGEADLSFTKLCRDILTDQAPEEKVLSASLPPLEDLQLPYDLYGEGDIAHRLIYVEASRGCPFRCEFCLSSLDIPLRAFPLDLFLGEMEKLLHRGVRHFKFVDRTFNLNLEVSQKILSFFLDHYVEGLFLHFEAIPDRFPSQLREFLTRFPPGCLQLEIGLQTFDEEVGKRIQRRQDYAKTTENFRFLREETHAHLHADLIVGLPGEDLESFGRGFDRLFGLAPHEIQVGILKRLRGTPIVRHTQEFGMAYREEAPYDLVENHLINRISMSKMNSFSRYWDRMANSGRFPHTLPLLWKDKPSPFEEFFKWSEYAFAHFERAHSLPLNELTELFGRYLLEQKLAGESETLEAAQADEAKRKVFALAKREKKHNQRQLRHHSP